MATCRAYLQPKTLYRGQTSDYAVVLSSGWRKMWQARKTAWPRLANLVDSYVRGRIDKAQFVSDLRNITSRMPNQPTFYRFLGEPSGEKLLTGLMTHIRESIGKRWQRWLSLERLAELEHSFLVRYQSFLLNQIHDTFIARYQTVNLRELASLVLEFFFSNREDFDVEFRISHVALDLMGILQHYGVVGTPGIDLTEDLDVALWFATNRYVKDDNFYEALEPGDWGIVYEIQAPMVIFSSIPMQLQAIDNLPELAVLNLSNLCPLFARIARQKGWYAILGRAWEQIIDFQEVLPLKKRRAIDYGDPAVIRQRLQSKGLSQDFLFPGTHQDPFSDHLARNNVATFL